MLTEATQRYSSLALAEATESLGSSLAEDAGRAESPVALSTLTADVPRGLELLSQVVFSPAFHPADFARKPGLEYPRLAKREEWEGTVVLRAQVLPSGRVGSVSVQKSSGHSVLDDAALAAAKTWSFVPATQGGQPVAGTVTFPVQFKLQ